VNVQDHPAVLGELRAEVNRGPLPHHRPSPLQERARIVEAEEALARVSDTVWRVNDATKRVLETGVTVEYDDGGGYDPVSYESVNLLNGEFSFSGAGYSVGSDLRIKTGNYIPMTEAAYCHSFSINKEVTLHDSTAFGDTDRTRKVGVKSAGGTLSQWDVTSSYFADALVAGEPVVIEYLALSSETPKRLWAMLDSQELQAALDSLQDEAVSFQSHDYYNL
jgi:hypothetical protein